MSANDRERLARDLKDLEQTRIKNGDDLFKLQEDLKLKNREHKQWWKEAKLTDKTQRKELKRSKKEEKLLAKANHQNIKNKKNEIAGVKADIKTIVKSDKALESAANQVAKNELMQIREQQRLQQLHAQQEEEKKKMMQATAPRPAEEPKQTDAAAKQTGADAKQTGADAKQADVAAKQTGADAKQTGSDAKKTTPAKQADADKTSPTPAVPSPPSTAIPAKQLTSEGSRSLKSPEVKPVVGDKTPGVAEPVTTPPSASVPVAKLATGSIEPAQMEAAA